MRRLLSSLCCFFIVLSLSGCEKTPSHDAQEASVAFNQFVELLRACGDDPKYQEKADKIECDKDKLWDSMDSSSKQQVVDAYVTLVRIDRIIKMYFDRIEHKLMRAQAGTDFIKDSERDITPDDYKEFFFRVFDPKKLAFNDNVESGLVFRGDRVENENFVQIFTNQTGQVFNMIREDDGVWRTSFFQNRFAEAFAPIFRSHDAMSEYAKGNLETELKRRDKVRTYFMIQAEVQRRQALEDINAAKQAEQNQQQENSDK